MDILLITIMCILLCRIHILKKNDYLSKKNCNNLKGIFAVFVIIHHLAQETNEGILFGYFSQIGFLAVSIFFFISGYGVMRQYIIKKEKYLETFLKKRVWGIFKQYIVVSFIYFLFRKLIYNDVTISAFFKSFINGKPIAYYSWFIIEILIFYIIFFISCKIFRDDYKKSILAVFIGILVFTFIYNTAGYGEWWYESSIAFVLGLIVGIDKLIILKYTGKKYILSVISSTILFIAMLKVNMKIGKQITDRQLIAFFAQITTCIFIILLLLIGKYIRIENKFTQYLGKISYEMYIMQGIPITLFRSKIVNISNNIIYSIVVIIATIILARIIKVIFGYITISSKRNYA